MKNPQDTLAKMLPVGGSASLQASDTTTQTAAARSAAEAYGQRGVFITTGTGGSKVTPSFEGSGGGNTLLIVASLAVGLVLFVLFRRKKK
jgi:hypothetical protein